MAAHASYPHFPGTLYDCAACEAECFCSADSTQCVHCAIADESTDLLDATHTVAAQEIGASVSVVCDMLHKADRHLNAFENAFAIPLDERPTNAVARRSWAINVVFYKHMRTTHDVAAILADIEDMRKLGRTERWQTALTTWQTMIKTNPYDDLDWVLMQYSTNTGYAAI